MKSKGINKCCFITLAIGFSSILLKANAEVLPIPARFSGNVYGSTKYVVGQADAMLPLVGDAQHNFYIDPALTSGSNWEGHGDLGLGYRWIQNGSAILGGYLFGEYNRMDNNVRIWTMNPGIEALGSRWDAHLNGYFVMDNRSKVVGTDLEFVRFRGHSAVYNLFDVTQNVGNGGDVKLGYQLFPKTPLKAFVGSYFFSPAETKNILGGAVGLEYWANRNVKVFASYTYDKLRRSVGSLGLGVELGGTHVHRSDPSIEERITDPLERNLAELGGSAAFPSQMKRKLVRTIGDGGDGDGGDGDNGGPGGEIPGINAFFSQTGTPNNGGVGLTLGNCTYENPCGPTDLTNEATQTLSGYLPNTKMYFLGGTYTALDVPGGSNPVTIRAGQSLTSYPGTPISTLSGGLIMEGNNSVNNMKLAPTPSTPIGISGAPNGNVLINGSEIGSAEAPYVTGVELTGSAQTTLDKSKVFGSTGVRFSEATSLISNASEINGTVSGIESTGSGLINLTNQSSVNVTGEDGLVGVSSTGEGEVTVSGASSINVDATGSAVGYSSGGSGAVNFSGGSAINVKSTGGQAIGIHTLTSSVAPVMLDETQIKVDGQTNPIGVLTEGEGSYTARNPKIEVIGGTSAQGVLSSGSGAIKTEAGTITVDGNGQAAATGFSTTSTSSGNVELKGTKINVSGGNRTRGLDVGGSGPIELTGAGSITVNAVGSSGILGISRNSGSTSDITLADNFSVDAIGGEGTIGISDEGTGTFTLGDENIISAMGDTNITAFSKTSAGEVNIGSSKLMANAPAGQALGLSADGPAVIKMNGTQIQVESGGGRGAWFKQTSKGELTNTIITAPNRALEVQDRSQVTVTGGHFTVGNNRASAIISGPGTSTINISGTRIDVTGPGIPPNAELNGIAKNRAGSGAVRAKDLIINVSSPTTGTSRGATTTERTSGVFTIEGSKINVKGGNTTSEGRSGPVVPRGGPITSTNNTCTLNGRSVNC
ncbi:inverse autotransporter beta-barrel domain-containing protein [Rickettsiella grylli]|uniref:Outer membrane autotransporter barrel domain n=1 Tax=Rickettsiella grylli TaxID=59196 RepID=A8PQI8_9COXI|nr:inverse autotransporter beta-barrel domain-containing protein [Rickettsiella grylli]EDP45901.1 putative outer membrane autotransporter barrel domain [Rickettsiella grylli]